MYIYREYFSKIPNWFSFVNTTVDAERMERSTNESLLFKNVLKDNKKQYLKGLRTIYGHFLYSSRSFLPTFFQNKTHKRMFKQKFFSVIPLFSTKLLSTGNCFKNTSFEVVNIILDYGHVNCSIELDKIKIIQKTNIKFPEAVLHK